MRSHRHQQNIDDKAMRAIDAIDSLIIGRLIDDPDLPDITDITSGRRFFLDAFADPTSTLAAALWVAVGIEHDRRRGHTTYGPGCELAEPTQFRSSRSTILMLLDGFVTAGNLHPVPEDPFAGLTEAF